MTTNVGSKYVSHAALCLMFNYMAKKYSHLLAHPLQLGSGSILFYKMVDRDADTDADGVIRHINKSEVEAKEVIIMLGTTTTIFRTT